MFLCRKFAWVTTKIAFLSGSKKHRSRMPFTAVARETGHAHVMLYHTAFARRHVSSLMKITLMPSFYLHRIPVRISRKACTVIDLISEREWIFAIPVESPWAAQYGVRIPNPAWFSGVLCKEAIYIFRYYRLFRCLISSRKWLWQILPTIRYVSVMRERRSSAMLTVTKPTSRKSYRQWTFLCTPVL